ncbi:MAG TPA: MarR family transcriptional regulator [Firmicutes bacterium]|nr:MarR family transcriptional regulator [Bacillota bacterium]
MELIHIKVLNTAIERILNKELAEYDITYTQATVIGYLKHHPEQDICQKDIEINLGLTHPTVSSILSRMEEKNMIETRNMASDRRYKYIDLTEKAMNISDEIHTVIQRITAELFAGVSKEEQQVFSNVLKTLISQVDKKTD